MQVLGPTHMLFDDISSKAGSGSPARAVGLQVCISDTSALQRHFFTHVDLQHRNGTTNSNKELLCPPVSGCSLVSKGPSKLLQPAAACPSFHCHGTSS
jgi:hypothetical protein